MNKEIFKPIYIIPAVCISVVAVAGYFFWHKKSLTNIKVLTIDTKSLRHIENDALI
jgi:hypothetical protein